MEKLANMANMNSRLLAQIKIIYRFHDARDSSVSAFSCFFR